jgi:hypothetical protein
VEGLAHRAAGLAHLHRPPAGQAAHDHLEALRSRERLRSQGAGRVAGGLHHRDAAERLAALGGLADEEVDVGLQEAAGAELQDGMAGGHGVSTRRWP